MLNLVRNNRADTDEVRARFFMSLTEMHHQIVQQLVGEGHIASLFFSESFVIHLYFYCMLNDRICIHSNYTLSFAVFSLLLFR